VRVFIDLTDAAADEVKSLCDATGLSIADLFRKSLSDLRNKVKWRCEKCGGQMEMFTADLDRCKECGNTRDGQ